MLLENLAHHHGGHGGEHGDAQSGEWVLALGHSHGGDHPSAQCSKSQLLGDFIATAGRLLRAPGMDLRRPSGLADQTFKTAHKTIHTAAESNRTIQGQKSLRPGLAGVLLCGGSDDLQTPHTPHHLQQ